jgi:hypothetical protein
MNRLAIRMMLGCCCALLTCFVVFGPPVSADTAVSSGTTAVDDLGNGQYRIGSIILDKTKGQFSVPGTVIELQQPNSPIEFIAVSKGGVKRYEAIFELDTSAVNFNLACILIGLDASHATHPKYHFDPQALKGDAVEMFVSWEEEGKTRRVPVTDVLRVPGGAHVSDEWIYTGSFFSPDGRYTAEVVGTLVGFVHDPESIIQHRSGLGLGNYGAVSVNPEVLPRPGTPVLLQVSRSAGQ